jgi:hypothetical protein
MTIKPRKTAKLVFAARITSPEYRVDPATGKPIPILGYVDRGNYKRQLPVTRGVFLQAAGTNEEGEVPDGFDRLLFTHFQIHVDDKGVAVGIDVIPNRMYRSKMIPTSMENVKHVTLSIAEDGAVVRVTKRPYNFEASRSEAIIRALDRYVATGKKISVGAKLGTVGTVTAVGEHTIEIRPRKGDTAGAPVSENYEELLGSDT